MRTVLTMLLVATVAGCVAGAARAEEQGLSVTVYSTADPAAFDPQRFISQQRRGQDPDFAWQVPGFGVVADVRAVEFDEGLNTIDFTDVAAFIDPTTVSLVDLDDPGATAVAEQQFLFDLVSPEKLLEKYLDREITVHVPIGERVEEVSGVLLSATGGRLVLQTEGGVRLVPDTRQAQVELGELPEGLITRPTLRWLLRSDEAGERTVRTTYQTDGLTWRADYNLVLGEDETSADLGAWVTLMNLSGASYPDARLKLIAGDVQRVEPRRDVPMAMEQRRMMMADAEADAFEERPFFEYHLYTLPRRTTIAQNTTQQIALFPTVHDVEVEKVLVYYGLEMHPSWSFFPRPRLDRDLGVRGNTDVDVYVRFDNTEENQLGIPMPRGKVRVYQRDEEDGALEFVGEDLIDHTPRNETLLIKVGQSFDVSGQRTQTDFRVDARQRVMVESFRIELTNAKDAPERVIVRENLYRWSNWEIVEQSDEFERIDARTIHFDVEVPAEGARVVEYTVRYTWDLEEGEGGGRR